jgi:uncharacterized membrane protein
VGGFIVGAVLIVVGAWTVRLGQRRDSPWTRRVGWAILALAAVYLLVGALAELGPDLTQE